MPTGRDIVCIGASAGGLQPLIEIVHALPTSLEAALFVVVHTGPDTPTMLPDILRSSGYLPVEVVRDERDIRTGHIYVAPPDHHLLLRRGFVRAVRGPRENGFRPAIDPLFRTAARSYGPRAVAVVLSGGQNDGSSGAVAVKRSEGVVIVQDPDTALVPQMPQSAIASVTSDHVLPPAGIAETIIRLAAGRRLRDRSVPAEADDLDPVEFPPDAVRTGALPGPPSSYSCALAENASLRRCMADRVQRRWPDLAEAYEKQALECDDQVGVLRKLLVDARNDADTPTKSAGACGPRAA